MSGIIALFILGVLFGLFYAVWKGSVYLAKRYLKSKYPSIYGVLSAVILVLLFSWDWIPAQIYYYQQCKAIGPNPITIYKTPEAWAKEIEENKALYQDPSRWKIKTEGDLPKIDKDDYILSSGYIWDDEKNMPFLRVSYKKVGGIKRVVYARRKFIDRTTGEALVSGTELEFLEKGYINPIFFPSSRYCSNSEAMSNLNSLYKNILKAYINNIKGD